MYIQRHAQFFAEIPKIFVFNDVMDFLQHSKGVYVQRHDRGCADSLKVFAFKDKIKSLMMFHAFLTEDFWIKYWL